MILEKYSIGVGDRFAHQAAAQLQACVKLAEQGIEVIPVWNKSNREHSCSPPFLLRLAAGIWSENRTRRYHVLELEKPNGTLGARQP